MGKDVFGADRFECSIADCTCKEYVCVMDAMTDEEKAAVLAAAERQSFRISDLLVRLAEQRGEVAGG